MCNFGKMNMSFKKTQWYFIKALRKPVMAGWMNHVAATEPKKCNQSSVFAGVWNSIPISPVNDSTEIGVGLSMTSANPKFKPCSTKRAEAESKWKAAKPLHRRRNSKFNPISKELNSSVNFIATRWFLKLHLPSECFNRIPKQNFQLLKVGCEAWNYFSLALERNEETNLVPN